MEAADDLVPGLVCENVRWAQLVFVRLADEEVHENDLAWKPTARSREDVRPDCQAAWVRTVVLTASLLRIGHGCLLVSESVWADEEDEAGAVRQSALRLPRVVVGEVDDADFRLTLGVFDARELDHRPAKKSSAATGGDALLHHVAPTRLEIGCRTRSFPKDSIQELIEGCS
jgi:hypothetical protein